MVISSYAGCMVTVLASEALPNGYSVLVYLYRVFVGWDST